jgi:hypothetical protein
MEATMAIPTIMQTTIRITVAIAATFVDFGSVLPKSVSTGDSDPAPVAHAFVLSLDPPRREMYHTAVCEERLCPPPLVPGLLERGWG